MASRTKEFVQSSIKLEFVVKSLMDCWRRNVLSIKRGLAFKHFSPCGGDFIREVKVSSAVHY